MTNRPPESLVAERDLSSAVTSAPGRGTPPGVVILPVNRNLGTCCPVSAAGTMTPQIHKMTISAGMAIDHGRCDMPEPSVSPSLMAGSQFFARPGWRWKRPVGLTRSDVLRVRFELPDSLH